MNVINWAGSTTLMILIALASIVAVILYVVYVLHANNLSVYTIQSSPLQVSSTQVFVSDGSKLPTNVSASEFSMSFWLYLNSASQSSATNKVIMLRGTGQTQYSTAQPTFLMSGTGNTLYAVLSTSLVNNKQTYTSANLLSKQGMLVLTWNYVPIQRWSLVTLVVKNGVAVLYVDGDVADMKNRGNTNTTTGASPSSTAIINPSSGSVYIGNAITIDGFVSKVQYANYAMNANQVGSIYAKGP